MFIREKYLGQLRQYRDQAIIKILIGVRRSGKSTLIEQFRTELLRQETSSAQIQVLNFDHLQDNRLVDPRYLLQYIADRLCKHQMNYLFLDEIEIVPDFPKVVQALNTLSNTDIYLTSSNKTILTPAILDIIAPNVVIPVFPYDFAEYIKKNQQDADSETLYQYLNQGGFPFATELHGATNFRNYLSDVFNSIIMTEFVHRNTLCNPGLTSQLARQLITHAGTSQNISQIVTNLKEHRIQASNKTVNFYLQFLQEALLFYPCYEYDLDRHRVKPTNVKYYPVDPSLRPALARKKNVLSQRNLENIVFLELLSRGYDVYSGQSKGQEITFVALKNGQLHCVQIAFSIANDSVFQRVTSGLRQAPNKYPKTLITVNPMINYPHNERIIVTDIYSWLTTTEV